jgi:guanosine-3',5'-bis(diphosphate) 3'-pyrophosphohydrolase
MASGPDFIAGRDLVGRAYEYARTIYLEPGVEEGAGIEHPESVAALVDAAGFDDVAVAAALLHDIIEDTPTGVEAIAASFGEEIGGYVEVLTEDESIADYEQRKAEHRERVLGSGSVPASIYLADKLARTRAFISSGEEIDQQRLDHYWDTLQLFGRRRPELPFLSELATELPGLEPTG